MHKAKWTDDFPKKEGQHNECRGIRPGGLHLGGKGNILKDNLYQMHSCPLNFKNKNNVYVISIRSKTFCTYDRCVLP